MARVAATQIENNFSKGLITEATGLNFPENSCTETYNCLFGTIGEATRRLGFDKEHLGSSATINRSNVVTTTYLWKDAGGDGTTSFVVVQIGSTLRFYNSTSNATVSAGLHATTIDLTTYSPSGAPSPGTKECQFSNGNGYLFVTHPNLEPFYITYTVSSNSITSSQISIQIRDFIGELTDNNYGNTVRSSSLSNAHKYNLYNQGWTDDKITKWNTSIFGLTTWSVGTGTTTTITNVYTQEAAKLSVGMAYAGIASSVAASTLFTAGTHTISSLGVSTGGGSFLSPTNLNNQTGTIIMSGRTGDTNNDSNSAHSLNFRRNDFPSNGDIWWYFKDSNDIFNIGEINNSTVTTPAPRGHFITSAWKIDRNTLSGLSGLTTTSAGFQRPSTTAFYAGRVWYGGIQSLGYNANLYFSQVLDNINKAGLCYQVEDPTDEKLFDLLPTDGGIITIHGCGTIHKLMPMGNSLMVFASNGVWQITGNQGIGFTAVDYSINKISSIPSVSWNSFVDVQGTPMWWNFDGIYAVQGSQQGQPSVQSLTMTSIDTFFKDIPTSNKKFVKGSFDPLSKIVQWVYRSTESGSLNQNYEFDSILNLNTISGAFYPWSISGANTMINDIVNIEGVSGNVEEVIVVDDSAVTVVDGSAATVTIFSSVGNPLSSAFKYLCSTPSGSTYNITFADNVNTTYKDWVSDTNSDYTSYFVSGYQIRGDAQRNFQDNYVIIHGRTMDDYQMDFQGIFDWATDTDSNRFGTKQRVQLTDTNLQYQNKRLLLRGTGKSCQFKVISISGKPFDLTGWSVYVTGNQSI